MITSAAKGHSDVVALLCQRGANIEALDNVSRRLIVSVEAMQYMFARMLLFGSIK